MTSVIRIGNTGDCSSYRSLSKFLSSLELIRGLKVKSVLPGHGPPFSGHKKRVDELKHHHTNRKEEVQSRDVPGSF